MRLFFLLILLLVVHKANAQIIIEGFVCDSNDKRLPFVNITATLKQQKVIKSYTFTDNNGMYQLKIIEKPLDTLVISASSIGFSKVEKSISLGDTIKNYYLNFQLNIDKTELPAFVISAEKPNKTVQNDTTTFKVKFYADSTERVLEDILKKIPGISVKNGGIIEYKGKPIERILIEGDDLFNTNTAIPTKNLHASLIEDIQIIDRYSSNALLKNIENSERQIINLNLKKDRKKSVFGSLNAGVGLTNNYEGNTNIISLLGKIKLFGLGGINNTGNDLGNNSISNTKIINRMNNFDYYDPSVEAPVLIPIPKISAPNLPERYLNNNQTKLASISFLVRPVPKWTFKAMGILAKDRIFQGQNNLNQYLLGTNQFSVTETVDTRLKPIIQNFHIENITSVNKNINIKVVNQYNTNDLEASSYININNQNINQDLSTHTKSYKNIISITAKLTDSTAIIVEGSYINSNRPQNLRLVPKDNYIDLINQPHLDFNSINQNTQINTQYSGFVAKLIKLYRGNHKLNLSLGGSIRQDRNFSAIFTEKNNVRQIFKDSNYINNIYYWTQDFFIRANYNKEIRNINISGQLLLIQHSNKLEDFLGAQYNFNKNWLYPMPQLSIKWKLHKYSSLSTTYSYKSDFADIDNIIGHYIFQNYRSLNRNNTTPYRINRHNISMLYRFDRPKYKLEGYFSTICSIDDNVRSYRYTFTPFITLSETINEPKDNQNYMFNTQIIKNFSPIKLSIKFETSHNLYTNYNRIENGSLEKNTQISNSYLMQFVSTYNHFFNFIGGFSILNSTQISKTNGQKINPKYIQQQFWFNTQWRFNKRLSLNINNSYTIFNSALGNNTNSIFTDIKGQYELKPSRIYLYLDIYNLFNIKKYTFTNINVNQIGIQSYTLLPRIQVLRCEWRF